VRIKTETVVGIFMLAAIAVFLYMGVQIRSWRLDAYQYHPYTICFQDVSGLSQQADVQIAGVKVGWVDEIRLVNNGQHVEVRVMVLKTYVLHANAYGIIRQDGMLGTKFLEVVPGDSQLPVIEPGGVLMQPDHAPKSADEMMHEVGQAVSHVQEISQQLSQGEYVQQLRDTLSVLQETAQHMASFVQRLDEMVANNSDHVVQTLDHVNTFSETLAYDLPQVMHQAHDRLNQLSHTLDHDMRHITDSLSATSDSIDRVAHKVESGEGVIGQLVSDPALSHDMRTAVEGAREYVDVMNRLAIIVDGHTEGMMDNGVFSRLENAKGYVNMRLHFVDDYFYLAGIAAIQGAGDAYIKDEETIRTYFDQNHKHIPLDELDLDDASRLRCAPFKREVERKFDQVLYNIQVGKTYDWIAFRIGLFDSAFGIATDVDIPFDMFHEYRLVSSLEAYDFQGRNRLTGHDYIGQSPTQIDDRPHLKWINKLFVTPHIYLTFGADDFISSTNKNFFVGAGMRFADDHLKYLISQVSF